MINSDGTQMGDVLDFARRLGDLLDVPLLAVAPQQQYPHAPEFYYPSGQREALSSTNNRAQLARWRPGHAIMAVMGGNVAVPDVDPRNGGDPERVRQLLDALHVRVYAEVETPGPGSGRHFYVAGHPELASAHNLTGWPGVDIQSFGSLLFLPGTQRPKWSGAEYKIVFDSLEALADGGDPDGGAALAGWVAERHGNREDFEPAPLWNREAPSQQQAAYLQAMIKNMHRELSITDKGGRNQRVYNAALKIGNFIAGAGLNEARATAMLLDACNHNGLITEDGEKSVMASIRSGIRNGKTRPRAVPAPNGQDHEPPEDDMPTDNPYRDESKRSVIITSASKIRPARVRWLWQDRLAVGTLALLAGREGVGKSILAYWLVAVITRGVLPGEHCGQPRAVMVAALRTRGSTRSCLD
ncbi:MAG TPA: AAA family ATPase [Propionibacteriaceae bacterium]